MHCVHYNALTTSSCFLGVKYSTRHFSEIKWGSYFILFPSQLTLEVTNKLYISAVSHPAGTKQGRGESSEEFSSNPLEDLSWRGLIRRFFQHVNCSRGQRDFPSPDALIHHIKRFHRNDRDSVTFCARTTLDRSTSSHCSVVTELKRTYGEVRSSKEFCPNCRRKFQRLTQGVFENGGAILVYFSEMVFFDECDKYDVEQS